MKNIFLFFIMFLCVFYVDAQKNIFVLVDVSKSVKSYQLDNARAVLKDVLVTGSTRDATVVGGELTDLQFYKLEANDRVAINAFGDLQTSASIIPILKPVNDIDDILNSIVWAPRDNWTYLTLARAKIAEFAKNRNINNYQLIEITDNVNDDYGPNGIPDYQGNTYLQDLITQYNTTKNKVTDNGWTKVAFGSDKKFLLSLTSGINISTYMPPKFQPTNSGITITFPSQTKKGAELEINDEAFTLTWACVKCQNNVEYSVFIEGYDNNTYSENIDTIKADSTQLKLTRNGMYQIVVSAKNCNLYPDTAFVKMNVVKDTKIKITSPVGTRKKPNEVNGENVNVSWRCPGIDENTTFTISIAGIDGTKMRDRVGPLKTKNYTANFKNLADGKYKITVLGTNDAISDTTYIEVSSCCGVCLFLILLLLIVVAGYFGIKKIRAGKSKQNRFDHDNRNGQGGIKDDYKNVPESDDGMF